MAAAGTTLSRTYFAHKKARNHFLRNRVIKFAFFFAFRRRGFAYLSCCIARVPAKLSSLDFQCRFNRKTVNEIGNFLIALETRKNAVFISKIVFFRTLAAKVVNLEKKACVHLWLATAHTFVTFDVCYPVEIGSCCVYNSRWQRLRLNLTRFSVFFFSFTKFWPPKFRRKQEEKLAFGVCFAVFAAKVAIIERGSLDESHD